MIFKRYNPGGKRISAGDMNRRADALESLMREGAHYPKMYEDPVFIAKIATNAGSGSYTATIETTTGSTCTLADGATITVKEANGATDVAVGTYILAKQLDNCYFFVKGGGATTFPCKITGSATLRSLTIAWGGGSGVSSPVAWSYSATEVAYNTSTGLSVDVSGGRTFSASGSIGSSTPPIFNLQEANASTTIVGATAVAASPFPTGFRALAIDAAATSQAHAQDVVVDVWITKNSAGADIYVCSVPPHFGGSCV